jgi:hypothetical protein
MLLLGFLPYELHVYTMNPLPKDLHLNALSYLLPLEQCMHLQLDPTPYKNVASNVQAALCTAVLDQDVRFLYYIMGQGADWDLCAFLVGYVGNPRTIEWLQQAVPDWRRTSAKDNVKYGATAGGHVHLLVNVNPTALEIRDIEFMVFLALYFFQFPTAQWWIQHVKDQSPALQWLTYGTSFSRRLEHTLPLEHVKGLHPPNEDHCLAAFQAWQAHHPRGEQKELELARSLHRPYPETPIAQSIHTHSGNEFMVTNAWSDSVSGVPKARRIAYACKSTWDTWRIKTTEFVWKLVTFRAASFGWLKFLNHCQDHFCRQDPTFVWNLEVWTAAARHSLRGIQWMLNHCPCPLPTFVLRAAARASSSETLRFLCERYPTEALEEWDDLMQCAIGSNSVANMEYLCSLVSGDSARLLKWMARMERLNRPKSPWRLANQREVTGLNR